MIGDGHYELFCDDNRWYSKPGVMQAIIGNMVPDIVLRSKDSGQNRIIIECNGTTEKPRSYGTADSQSVRYFLWLLTMTESRRGQDIRRAVLVAAPSLWFSKNATSQNWNYLVQTYRPLGSERLNEGFDITFAEIRSDNLGWLHRW